MSCRNTPTHTHTHTHTHPLRRRAWPLNRRPCWERTMNPCTYSSHSNGCQTRYPQTHKRSRHCTPVNAHTRTRDDSAQTEDASAWTGRRARANKQRAHANTRYDTTYTHTRLHTHGTRPPPPSTDLDFSEADGDRNPAPTLRRQRLRDVPLHEERGVFILCV